MQPLHSTPISMSIHPGIFSSQGPSGPSLAKAQGTQGCSAEQGQPPFPLLFQSQLSPAPVPRELHTKLLMGRSWLPQLWFNHPFSKGTPWWAIKPLQTPPGDSPALPWVCGAGSAPQHTARGHQDVGPICDPGFPQEAQSPRGSSCAAPGGAQRAKTSREESNVTHSRVSRILAGSG